MKILKHGDSIVFTCSDCGCVFSEISEKCYSSMGGDGCHYIESCPECNKVCYATDKNTIRAWKEGENG